MKDTHLAANIAVPKWKPGKIPEESTYLNITTDPEDQIYKITFKYYRNDLCEIKSLLKNRGRDGLDTIKRIGQSTFRTLYSNGVNHYPVENVGAYSELFAGLPSKDIEMKEHKMQGESRIFFFLEGGLFHVVAIKDVHLETDKHR